MAVTGVRSSETALLARVPGGDNGRAWWPTARCALVSPRAEPPLNLLLVAAKLSLAGFRCKLVDYKAEQLEWGAIQSDLVKHHPSLVIFDTSLVGLNKDMAAVRRAKALLPDCAAVLCGRDLLFEEARIHWECPELDGIISDPYRFASPGHLTDSSRALMLLQSRRKGQSLIIRSFARGKALDINNMLRPHWEILKRSCYVSPFSGVARLPVLASVGCKHNCLHCIVPHLSGGITHWRRPSVIVKEMRHGLLALGERKVPNEIAFELVADNLAPPELWWEELVAEMSRAGLKTASFSFRACECSISKQLAQKLKSAGCDMATIVLPVAMEKAASTLSFGPRLDEQTCIEMVRTLRQAGIATCLCFVAGLFARDQESLRSAIKLAARSNASMVELKDALATAGSRLDDVAKRKWLSESEIQRWESASSSHAQEASELAQKALRRFWMRPAPLIEATRRFGPSALAKVARMLLRSGGV